MKKSPSAIGLSAVLVAVLNVSSVANDWTGTGGDQRWDNAANWSQGVVPLGAWQHPSSGWDDPSSPFYPLTPNVNDDGPVWNNDAKLTAEDATILIDQATVATAFGVRIGLDGASNTLEMTGGRLEVGGIPPGESNRVGWHLDVGRGFNRTANPNPLAKFVMTGGVIDTNIIKVPEGFVDESLADPYDTPGLNGEMFMSGGTIVGRKLNIGQFTGNGYAEISGDAKIMLWPNVANMPNNGGHFEMKQDWYIFGQPYATMADAYLDIRDEAEIQIFGNLDQFKTAPDQAELDRYQQYVDDGWLTANNGTAVPDIVLEPCPTDGSFDDYCLSGVMITISAPEVVTPGDFDSNGVHDCSDVDALVAEITAGNHDGSFDLTGDALVNVDDLTEWRRFAGTALGLPGSVLPADANLDGSVNGQDFVRWNNFKFTAGNGFCGGDFNADGFTNGQDFVIWNTFKFQESDVQAVPEPAGWLLSIFAVLGCCRAWSTISINGGRDR
jgi:hypothetical protein